MVIETSKYIKHCMSLQNYIQSNMDAVFAQTNIKPMIFLGVGTVMALIGLLKIIGNGISILLWVAILITGISAIKYGMNKGGFKLPDEITAKFSQMVEPEKSL